MSVVGRPAQPASHSISLTRNMSGVDFLTGCVGTPSFTMTRHRHGKTTVIDYDGDNWDTAGCGAVTVTAYAERGAVPIHTYQQSSFTGQLKINGRICGLELHADQPNGRTRTAGYMTGNHVEANVQLADPGTTPSGEQLLPGDALCKSDVGGAAAAIDSGQLSGGIVSSVALILGQNLLELQNTRSGNVFLADAAGKVAVQGVSAEGVPSGQIAADEAALAGSANAQALPATVNGDENLSGFGTVGSSATITGTGAVLVTGNITAADATFSTDDMYGLIAGGQLNLP